MRFLRSVLAAPFPAAGSTISVAPPPRPSIAAAAPGAALPLLCLTRPDDLDSPFCDVNFGPLCTRLSVENLLRLFGAMLAESRIVFLSSKLSRLSACIHAVSTRILGRTMRDAVRNKEWWEKAPYAYQRS